MSVTCEANRGSAKKIDNGRFPELRAFRLTSAEELVWIYL